jgi:phosphohistidine phosphatase
MLAILQTAPANASQVLLVGHNPELQTFALDLIGSGPNHLKDRIETHVPTAALTVIRFQVGAWKDVGLNSGKLELFLTPSELEQA